MNVDEVQRMADLARRLGSTPRRMILGAARMVDLTMLTPQDALANLRRTGNTPFAPADECANLLLTPIASYARDGVGNALTALWRDFTQAES